MIHSLKLFLKLLLPRYQKLILDYKVEMKPRYGYGLKPHLLLYEIINKNRGIYIQFLKEILLHKEIFKDIKSFDIEKDENQPAWNNGYFPGLDIISLYTMIAFFKPKMFIEIGSGNSTKVVRKCLIDNNLNTKVVSIDPFPRGNINHLVDECIRQPIENIVNNQFIIDDLHAGDILFIDNSHRCLPNSDVMVCFMELLPNLKRWVIVHVHDICLPYDYPQNMCDRFYSEQYVLAAFLLANPEKYKTIFPSCFIGEDKELNDIISPIWQFPNSINADKYGGSFWIEIC